MQLNQADYGRICTTSRFIAKMSKFFNSVRAYVGKPIHCTTVVAYHILSTKSATSGNRYHNCPDDSVFGATV